MWTLGGTRIYPHTKKETASQIIPKLQPLNGGTVHQVFGYESPEITLTCLVVGSGDKNHLISLTTSGTSFELVGPEGSYGNYLVRSVKPSRSSYAYQTIRKDLSCTTPVYECQILLYEDS